MESKISDSLIDQKDREWICINSEEYRVYTFPGAVTVRIDNPCKLRVSESGGHRIMDCNGHGHYVPSGWVHIKWVPKPGEPTFVH